MQIQAQLLTFEHRQWPTDLDLAKNAFAAFCIALAFRAAGGNDCQRICNDLFCVGHKNLHRNVLILFSFCREVNPHLGAPFHGERRLGDRPLVSPC